jgi:hypothetical protein
MPTWKFHRGEDFSTEGHVTFATVAGATMVPANIVAGALTFHMGVSLDVPLITRAGTSGGTCFVVDPGSGTLGTYLFQLSPADTENLPSGNYLYDLWYKTSGAKEYCLTVGTIELQGVVGTI